jgi:hypothetical protein
MFDKDTFQKRIKQQCKDSELQCCEAWKLGDGVFTARIKKIGSRDWTFAFYFDNAQSKYRDVRLIDRTLQFLMTEFESGKLSKNESDSIEFFHFGGKELLDECPVGTPENTINVASNMLLQANDEEILWPEHPEKIEGFWV